MIKIDLLRRIIEQRDETIAGLQEQIKNLDGQHKTMLSMTTTFATQRKEVESVKLINFF